MDNRTDWHTEASLQIGDRMTFQGRYRRRTLWEWLTRKPREPQVYRCVAAVTANSRDEPIHG